MSYMFSLPNFLELHLGSIFSMEIVDGYLFKKACVFPMLKDLVPGVNSIKKEKVCLH